MNLPSLVLWGFVATLVMSTVLSASQGLGFSRMSLPFILGTIFTPDRNKAPVAGFVVHLLGGWGFAVIYGLVFEALGRATWWLGVLAGAVHGFVVLVVFLPLLPGFHPRMASEHQGPEPTHALEPPGFLGLNYGRRTPLIAFLAHLAYGAILGGFYELSRT